MAPKGRRAGAKPAAKKAAAKRSAAKAAPSNAGALAASQPTRRQLGRRDTNEATERALKQHCGHVPPQVLASAIDTKSGLGVHEMVAADIRAARSSGARLGAVYWRDLNSRFGFTALGRVSLQVKDASQPLGEDLMASCKLALASGTAIRDSKPLAQLLLHRPSLLQRELCMVVGTLNEMSQRNLVNRDSIKMLWLNLASCIVRLGLGADYVAELVEMKPAVEQGLILSWQRAKAAGVSPRTWMMTTIGVIKHYADSASIDVILEKAATQPHETEDAVATVTNQLTVLCMALGDLVAKVAGRRFEELLLAELHKLPQCSTEAEFQAIKKACVEIASAELARNPRSMSMASILWFADEVEFPALDVHATWSFQYSSRLKGELLKHDRDFVRLPHEEWILPPVQEGDKFAVPADDLASWTAARRTAVDLLAAYPHINFDSMVSHLERDSSVLVAIDPTIEVELQWLRKFGAARVVACMHDKMLENLPSESRPMTLTEAVERFKNLDNLDLFKRAPFLGRKDYVGARDMLNGLAASQCPQVGSNVGAFTRSILAAFEWFYTDPSAQGKQPKRGKAALVATVVRMTAQQAKAGGPKLQLADIQRVQCFRWLLTSDQSKNLVTWAKEAVVESTAAASSSSSRRSRRSTQGDAGAQASNAEVDLMSLL